MSALQTSQKEQKKDTWHRTSLALMASEALKVLTSYLNGLNILTLYGCGSGLLNYKLRKNGAVTHFRVRYGLDVFPPHRDWRNHNFRALSLFSSLTSLELLGFQQYAFRYFGTPIISMLPPTMEVIRFDFIESLTMWVDITKSVTSREAAQGREFVPYYLDEHFPQHLRVLELNSRFWDRLTIYPKEGLRAFTWQPELRHEFLSHIPHSVTRLGLSLPGLQERFGENLPPELEILEVDASEGPRRFIQYLPRQIKRLVVNSFSSVLSADEFQHLPPTLEYFEFEDASESRPTVFARPVAIAPNLLVAPGARAPQPAPTLVIGDQQAQQVVENGPISFPPSLHTIINRLEASWFNEPAVQLLPSTLTYLQLKGTHCTLENSVVQHFPRSLTVLLLATQRTARHNIDEHAFMDLPQSLVRLNLASAAKLPWSCFELLPASLRHFSHVTFVYAAPPEDPQASVGEASNYWKSFAPNCVLDFTHWNGEPPAEPAPATAPNAQNADDEELSDSDN